MVSVNYPKWQLRLRHDTMIYLSLLTLTLFRFLMVNTMMMRMYYCKNVCCYFAQMYKLGRRILFRFGVTNDQLHQD